MNLAKIFFYYGKNKNMDLWTKVQNHWKSRKNNHKNKQVMFIYSKSYHKIDDFHVIDFLPRRHENLTFLFPISRVPSCIKKNI